MQIADLHFSVNQGVCRETIITPCTAADDMSISLLADTLDKEKPDLVVFSGDQLNGQGTSWDAKSVLAKFARAVTDRQIPWAAIFGNHDDEDGDTRAEQIKYMQGLPYSLVQAGPKDIHGVGNYLHKVYSADPWVPIYLFYVIDTHTAADQRLIFLRYISWTRAHTAMANGISSIFLLQLNTTGFTRYASRVQL